MSIVHWIATLIVAAVLCNIIVSTVNAVTSNRIRAILQIIAVVSLLSALYFVRF